jgi:gamma-glutamylcyclotransferase
MTFLYFAYGSNMLTERLRDRCPSATPIGIAIAPNHALTFGKLSNDKSGKATLVGIEGVKTPGVIFEMCSSDLQNLDKAEGSGKGYDRHDQFAITQTGTSGHDFAMTYLGNDPKDGLKPYDWYLALVVAGAIQHQLCPDHIQMLRQTPYNIDGNLERESRRTALSSMKAAGHQQYDKLLLNGK